MQGVVPHAEIAPLLQQGFVALASDADDPEDEVVEHARKLEDAYMLPFVIFVAPDGSFAGGSSGMVNPKAFQKQLQALRGS